MIQLAECLLTTTALRSTGEGIHPVTQDAVSWPHWPGNKAGPCALACILFWLVFVSLTQTTHLRREPQWRKCLSDCPVGKSEGVFLDW